VTFITHATPLVPTVPLGCHLQSLRDETKKYAPQKIIEGESSQRRTTHENVSGRDPMTQVHCAALLFDMDGVLVNSTPAVARVWRQWAIEHGFDPEEVVARAHGRPSLTTVREYLPNSDHETENREVERREIADLEGVIPLPGALSLLASLPPDRWTIVTSCTRALAEVRIRAAGLPLPKKLITSNDITHGKPHPEPFLKGASVLGFPSEDCIVVEDVPAGVRAGKAAHAKVIAFRTTVDEPLLRDAGADWVLNNCSQIRLLYVDHGLQLELG